MDIGRVLVLNQTYEAFQVCSARRRGSLRRQGGARRGLRPGPRSPSTVFVVPSVIRLQHYVRKPTQAALAFSKKNIFSGTLHLPVLRPQRRRAHDH